MLGWGLWYLTPLSIKFSVILCRSVSLVEETEHPQKKPTDLSQVIAKHDIWVIVFKLNAIKWYIIILFTFLSVDMEILTP